MDIINIEVKFSKLMDIANIEVECTSNGTNRQSQYWGWMCNPIGYNQYKRQFWKTNGHNQYKGREPKK